MLKWLTPKPRVARQPELSAVTSPLEANNDDTIVVARQPALKERNVNQAQNKRRRSLEYVCVPKLSEPQKEALLGCSPNPEPLDVFLDSSQEIVMKEPSPNRIAVKEPSPDQIMMEEPTPDRIVMKEPSLDQISMEDSDDVRPTKRLRRGTSRRSYALALFSDDSEDELFSKPKPKKSRTKSDCSGSEFGSNVISDSGGESETEIEEMFSGEESSHDPSEPETDLDDAPPTPKKSSNPAKKAQTPLNVSRPTGKTSTHMMENLLKGSTSKGLDLNLPPLSNIPDIFSDITTKGIKNGLVDVVNHLGNRPLKVGTMCSGTESPLLALSMIQESLATLCGQSFAIEHLYSAEIVPFKQAYIERNFKPPIIFRDITELTDAMKEEHPMATTAYGSRVAVPTSIDLLVAGTSCVDFSRLNNHQKGLEGGGESDKTWHAVLAYCKVAQPPIVILENVKNAHWDLMLEHYQEAGYESAGVHVDTKDYYIPHTRQRGYMVCFHKEKMAKSMVKNLGPRWQSLMNDFKRKASSPVSSFLLPSDIVPRRKTRLDEPTREVDWSACEIRQMDYRQKTGIGNARPFTNWQESGTISLPETDSTQYLSKQVERVKDVVECASLRKALPKNGMFDARFKTRIWDLSQNIDRNEDTAPFGITGCITPSGQFFVSDAGRALTPEETLTLQGLPLDRISFTTELPNEIQDLAGNAMTASVVGCAIVSALICGHSLINNQETSRSEAVTTLQPKKTELHIEDAQASEHDLTLEPWDLQTIMQLAKTSNRKCYCEGALTLAEKPIQECRDCAHTTCIACGGNPAHNYSQSLQLSSHRITPAEFEETLRSIMPLRLSFADAANLAPSLKAKSKGSASFIDQYVLAVKKSVDGVFCLSRFRRSNCWTVLYTSTSADLHLVLQNGKAEWRLFVHPDEKLPCNNSLRAALQQPVAKCIVSDSLLTGDWQWRVPANTTVPLTITPQGNIVASWWSHLGIPTMKDHRMYDQIKVEISPEHDSLFERSIAGTYAYFRNCGKACDSLFKRIDGEIGEEPLYLFLDPTRTGDPEKDTFVFSNNNTRLSYDEVRPIIARIARPWVPWAPQKSLSRNASTAKSPIEFTWAAANIGGLDITKTTLNLTSTCQSAVSSKLLDCNSAPLLQACVLGGRDDITCQKRIQTDDRRFFSKHAWIFEAMRRQLGDFAEWQHLPQNLTCTDDCMTCAPPKPVLRWKLASDGDTITPYEDTGAAADYERTIKSRPTPMLIDASYSSQSLAEIKFGVNVMSLAHRARAKFQLPIEDISFKWNLKTQPDAIFNFQEFTLSSTKGVEPYSSDLGMSVDLFPNQQLALGWMKLQESGHGIKFMLEESEEARIPELGWRAELRAEAAVYIRGGICADHPGFGKTITSLGLIGEQFLRQTPQEITRSIAADQTGAAAGLIPVAATLIVCPGVLLRQWMAEIREKLRWKDGLLSVNSIVELRRLSISDFKSAKIIVVNRTVLGSEQYAERLAVFAGTPGPATKSGRSFAQWLEFATKQVAPNLEVLQKSSITELKKVVRSKYKDLLNSDSFKANVPSRRLRGKSYVAGKSAKTDTRKAAAAELNTEGIDTPLFEMFYFNRIIIDEFHQYDTKEYSALKALKAHKRWGLSATPALDDFYDLAQMAGLIGVSLRVGSDSRGIMKAKNVREMRKEMTDFERFDSMRQMPSEAVHARIHEIDQLFLDTFVRRNIMDFGQIEYRDSLAPITLDLDHRAAYTELSQHLNSLDMRIRKGKRGQQTDRAELLREAIQDSTTAEEALSKAAAAFDRRRETDGLLNGKPDSGLQSWIVRRQREVEKTIPELRSALWLAKNKEAEAFKSWKQTALEDGMIGDEGTIAEVKQLIQSLGSQPPEGADAKSKKSKSKKSSDDSDEGPMAKPCTTVNNICKQLVVSARSLRFLRSIQQLQHSFGQKGVPEVVDICDGSNCKNTNVDTDIAVSSFCGHKVCQSCHDTLQVKECPANGCACSMFSYHLLWKSKMGDLQNPSHTQYGGKMETTLNLLESIRNQGDQAIIFVQYATQLNEVEKALSERAISATVVADASRASEQITDFQKTTDPKKRKTVIVLNASDETAAGSNLQNANHVIFFSPLLRDSQYGYDATMAQAIGRVRRHGQKKKIFVYRVVALDTIDVDILEHRERRSTALAEEGIDDIEPPASMMEIQEPQRERTQLVRENGKFSLRPQSWLVEASEGANMDEVQAQKVRGKYRVAGWEDFSSLVKFSRAYTEDDD
ncbi:Hypothetical protein R9X50_00316900 [Acrodontium crateriforme]|uniref:Helicase C-terminal domain-containing protein n=1 Tax=Acrodontium crateriforme TaxID=150365 RepID=A0AAQ3R778_9PEZI|nr:Hypothetical protein R9X50_00316900 [Acrodontium crateriforme]